MNVKFRGALITLAVLSAAAVALGGVWFIAKTVQSPAQREAAAASPTLDPIAVVAQRGTLVDQLTAKGSVSKEGVTTISVPLGDGTNVVTDTGVAVGHQLIPGQSVLRINGRPLIALMGDFPTYRDLTEGDEGDDVRQLQIALVEIGYSLTIDGQFGSATASAVTQLYRAIDFEPLVSTTSDSTRADGASSQQSSNSSTSKGSSHSENSGDSSAQNKASEEVVKRRVTVPRGEIIYIPQSGAGAVVSSIPSVGTTLTDSSAVITLRSGLARVKAEVPQATAESLQAGVSATATIKDQQYTFTLDTIESPSTPGGAEASGNIAGSSGGQSSSSDSAGGAAATSASYTLTFSPDLPLPADLTQDESVLLTIDRSPTLTDVIVIPKRAVVTAPNGQHTVLRQESSGQFVAVQVEVLGCVGSQCAVSEESLTVGDRVRVDGS
ncbi:peptidoglycan-binding domain-containing protein [Actinomyces procaprae]|uniref:peptidoglycan-binding domain-containing protein n=1 Tax=Actinomyces procaprae TaxID=2560010 RepID=UPI0010A22DF4|nr:peptidoglycan-binding domain-containing protein [Actinomyces procaprae]